MGKSLGKLQDIYGYYGKIIGNYASYGKITQLQDNDWDHSGKSLGHKMGKFYDIHIGIRLENIGKYWENDGKMMGTSYSTLCSSYGKIAWEMYETFMENDGTMIGQLWAEGGKIWDPKSFGFT